MLICVTQTSLKFALIGSSSGTQSFPCPFCKVLPAIAAVLTLEDIVVAILPAAVVVVVLHVVVGVVGTSLLLPAGVLVVEE